ncbi:MAG: hypothetical protein AB1486_17655 [Planctomycetota bacterium]
MKNIHKLRERTPEQILLEEGVITAAQAEECRQEHLESGEPLSTLLQRVCDVTEWDIAKSLVKHLHFPFIRVSSYSIPKDVIEILPSPFLHQHRIVPLDLFGGMLVLATTGEIAPELVEDIEKQTGFEVALYLSLPSDIASCLETTFPLQNVSREVAARLDQLFGV